MWPHEREEGCESLKLAEAPKKLFLLLSKEGSPGTSSLQLGPSVPWPHVSKATASLNQTLTGKLCFPEINQHIEEQNGCRPTQTVAWIQKGHWCLRHFEPAKILTIDWPKKRGEFPGEIKRLMGETFRENQRQRFRHK